MRFEGDESEACIRRGLRARHPSAFRTYIDPFLISAASYYRICAYGTGQCRLLSWHQRHGFGPGCRNGIPRGQVALSSTLIRSARPGMLSLHSSLSSLLVHRSTARGFSPSRQGKCLHPHAVPASAYLRAHFAHRLLSIPTTLAQHLASLSSGHAEPG